MRLLKALGSEAREPTLADLVRAVRFNKATAYRRLTALEAEGLVEPGSGDGYRLGPELLALGAHDPREAARISGRLGAVPLSPTATVRREERR